MKDVLDQEFYAGNRYEYTDRLDTVEPESLRDGLRPGGANEVLRMGIEFAGDLWKWKPAAAAAEIILSRAGAMRFQVDNSQYRFNLLLKPVDRGRRPVGGEWRGGKALCGSCPSAGSTGRISRKIWAICRWWRLRAYACSLKRGAA